jgi:hypothetical protein
VIVRALDVFAALVVVVLIGLVVLALRRRLLTRSGGTFDCSLRAAARRLRQGWALGIGRYAGTPGVVSGIQLCGAPRQVLARRDLEILERRPPVGPEVFSCSPERSS